MAPVTDESLQAAFPTGHTAIYGSVFREDGAQPRFVDPCHPLPSQHQTSSTGSTMQGILSEDILYMIFATLRDDEMDEWERHHCFSTGERSLATCALVSSYWRQLAQPFLFRDLVFTRGRPVTGKCEMGGHRSTTCEQLCSCSCHLSFQQQCQRGVKTLPALLRFLCSSPHLGRFVRTLRLRTSPLDVRQYPTEVVNAATVLEIIGQVPNVTTLYLEDISLTSPRLLSSPPPPVPSLKHLILSSGEGFRQLPASRTLDTLSYFRHIGRLRFVHHGEMCTGGDGAGNSGMIAESPLTVRVFELERMEFVDDGILAFLVESAAPRVTVRTASPTDASSMLRLRRFVENLGPRLEHLEYKTRSDDDPCPLLSSSTPNSLETMAATSAALDLGQCAGLHTLKFSLSLRPRTLAQDVFATIVPTLGSLHASAAEPLQLLITVALAEVLQEFAVPLCRGPLCEALSRLEDAILEAQSHALIGSVTVELEAVSTECSSSLGMQRMARARDLVHTRFPRLGKRGKLYITHTSSLPGVYRL